MHQPDTAAMIGLSVLIPTVGTQRHNSGRSVTSAPEENARPPIPVRIATRCSERPNAPHANCSSTATALLMAFSFSGRLMAITETGPRCSTVTTDILNYSLLHLGEGWGPFFNHASGGSIGPGLRRGDIRRDWSLLKLPNFYRTTSWMVQTVPACSA